MLREKKSVINQFECVYIENLVPEDHLLRKFDKYIDFSFIYKIIKPYYYEDNGRPPLDPVVIFKILLIGYWFGIRSERQLIKELEVNITYHWFLGYSLTDTVPNHSTLSKNRTRRFNESDVYKEIFDEIVFKAIDSNLVKGKILYSDSTHIKANTNKQKFIKKEVEKNTRSYLEELEDSITRTREKHGQKPLKKKNMNLK